MSDTLDRQVANLRLQLAALEETTKAASLPTAVSSLRKTVTWSAIVIALALVLSSLIRMWSDDRVHVLEKRIEQLEKTQRM